ncbi:hypothetical protein WA026_005848 [Henosepilachna vigintioctopunctata]|uniref:Cytochrome P450 n=1 Tax=Henosepilachna vigintioctopunctata TaxID=420089 RepID=A0AAW1U4F2_9CUCU
MIFIACVVFLAVFITTRYLLFRKPSDSTCKSLNEIPCPGSIPILGNICDMFYNDGESWKKRRKLLTKNFHFAALHNYMEIFNKEGQKLGDRLQKDVNQSTDILELISHSTLKIINEILVGEELKLREIQIKDYVSAIDTFSKAIGYINSKPILSLVYKYSEMKKEEDRSLEIINTFAKDLLKNWKVKPSDNPRVLDVMLDAPSLYDDQGVMDEIITFIFAGNSTSSAGLLYALFNLANHSEYQDEVYEEIVQIVGEKEKPSYADLKSMSFLDRFLRESMRLYPPAPFIGRTIAEDVVTKTGYRIPAGTEVVFHIFDIHRSPFIYDNPDTFDPDRFLPENSKKRHPFSYLPFSAGPRNCIAQKFALLEIKSSICKILKKFKLEPVTLAEDIKFIPDVTLATKEKIKIKLISRS